VEQALLALGARPHIGKSSGYGPVSKLPNEYPFRNMQVLGMLYDPARRSAIQGAMAEWDPNGVFRQGGALQLVGLPGPDYDPRSYNGDTCSHWDDEECFEGCCCNDFIQCGLLGILTGARQNECVATGRSIGDDCDVDCQCSSGNCKGIFLFLMKRCQAK